MTNVFLLNMWGMSAVCEGIQVLPCGNGTTSHCVSHHTEVDTLITIYGVDAQQRVAPTATTL
jgi:hypothetical protein